MESFWGKMKCEWLYGKDFKTRQEARAAVFEYIEIFYNRQSVYMPQKYQLFFIAINNCSWDSSKKSVHPRFS